MSERARCLTFSKGEHSFVFRFSEGREPELLACFVRMASDPASPFDWFDAAVMSYQLGQQLERKLEPVG